MVGVAAVVSRTVVPREVLPVTAVVVAGRVVVGGGVTVVPAKQID